MIEGLKIRQAMTNDVDFVIEAIIESEKSGTDIIGTSNIFLITESRFREILRELLLQDIPDYDYYLSGFIIAEKDGEYAGAMGSWIEAADETPSGIIKTTMMYPFFDRDKTMEINRNANLIKGLTINREPGALQLEYDYTCEKFRRQGVFSSLVKENIIRNMKNHKGVDKVQAALLKSNFKSLNAHLKLGFEVVEEKRIDDPEILKFFPSNTKLLVELNKDKLSAILLDQ